MYPVVPISSGICAKSFLSFESRFQAQMSKLNSHFSTFKLPEALMAFLLLGNANVDQSQNISVKIYSKIYPYSGPHNKSLGPHVQRTALWLILEHPNMYINRCS